MKRVIVESPYMGDILLNEIYGEICMHDCLVNHDESPYASHLLYTRKNVLRDHIPQERRLGINAGFCWREAAEETIFYTDLGMTPGMLQGLEDCQKGRKEYDVRSLPDELWERFVDVCGEEQLPVPERK